ncbi:MAG: conjugal transfer protein TrbF [Novosphingobium sp.]
MKKRKEPSSAPETPYLAARREWNERYGSYVKAASNWRVAALASMGIALCAVGGLIAVSMQTKVVPYAVELNGHQEVVRVQRADLLSAPNANQIRASLRNWVIGARTVYGDRFAMKNLIDQTYAMTMPDSRAYTDLANYHRANNPYERAANETVSVDVKVVVPVSDTSWQVEWTETTKQTSGKVVGVQEWQGTFTIAVSPPTDAKQIMMNPLGLYVRQFSWTSRLQSQ